MSNATPSIPFPGCLPSVLVAGVSTLLGSLVVALALAFFHSRLCLGSQQITFVAYGVPAISAVIFAALLIRATRKIAAAMFRAALLLVVLFAIFGANAGGIARAFDEKKQSETMRSMKVVAAELARYRERHQAYPDGSGVETLLVIDRDLPRRDAWGNEFRFWSGREGYRLVSGGACGELEIARGVEVESRAVAHPRDDLVVDNGRFVRWAE